MRTALDREARGAIEDFAPDWVLVSCGFDAHRDDPLSNLELSAGDYAELARIGSATSRRPAGSPSSSKAATTWPHSRHRSRRRWRRCGQRNRCGPADVRGPWATRARGRPVRAHARHRPRRALGTALTGAPTGGRGGSRGVRDPMHEHRARRVRHAVLADRAKHHPDELPMTPAADDEQVGVLRGVHQRWCWMPVDHLGIHRNPRVRVRTLPAAVSSVRRTSASGSNSSGTGTAQPKLVGHSHVITISRTQSVRSAWRAAHARAPRDASDPSIPTTILPVPAGERVPCRAEHIRGRVGPR